MANSPGPGIGSELSEEGLKLNKSHFHVDDCERPTRRLNHDS